jgi:hypothetical protein
VVGVRRTSAVEPKSVVVPYWSVTWAAHPCESISAGKRDRVDPLEDASLVVTVGATACGRCGGAGRHGNGGEKRQRETTRATRS